MDLGSINWGFVAICAGVIAWFSIAIWIAHEPKGNPPEVYEYKVIAEYVKADGTVWRECSDQPVTITLPATHNRPVHIYRTGPARACVSCGGRCHHP